MKKHNSDQMEVIDIFIDEHKHPIAFKTKLDEMVKSGLTEDEAKRYIYTTPFQMELYYQTDSGAFMVESEAVENTDIFNPYTGEQLEDYIEFDEEDEKKFVAENLDRFKAIADQLKKDKEK